MRKWLAGLVAVVIAVAVATIIVVIQSSTPGASARTHDQIQLDLIVTVLPAPDDGTGKNPDGPGPLESTLDIIKGALSDQDFQVDSFFDVYYVTNIGSSGEDGVSFRTGGNFDVFFEVDYRISRAGTIETEMVALSLTSTAPDPTNPQGAIDAVKRIVEARKGRVFYGHVTVLK